MKKSKKLLSLLLAAIIALSSLTVGFYAIAAETKSDDLAKVLKSDDAAVTAVEEAVAEFHSNGYNKAMFNDDEAAVKAFDELTSDIKALTEAQKLALPVSNYVYVAALAAEKVGRDAGLSSSAAKAYGINDGLGDLEKLMGDLPKDYKDAVTGMQKIYVKVGSYFFSASFDFKKAAAAGNEGEEHYNKMLETVKSFTPAGVAFANFFYTYPSASSFYINCSSPTYTGKFLVSNLCDWVFNYYQDKTEAGATPTISSGTFIKRTKGDDGAYVYSWQTNKATGEAYNGVTYAEGYEKYINLFKSDVIEVSKTAIPIVAETLAAVYGKELVTAAEKALSASNYYLENGNIDFEAGNEAIKAMAAADELCPDFTKNVLRNNKFYINAYLDYKLGSAEAYTADLTAAEVYASPISSYRELYNVYIEKVNAVVIADQIKRFEEYINSIDLAAVTPEIAEEALAKYYDIEEDYRKDIDVDMYAKLVAVVTKEFTDFIDSVSVEESDKDDIDRGVELYYAIDSEFRKAMDSSKYDKLVEIVIKDFRTYVESVDPSKATKTEADKALDLLNAIVNDDFRIEISKDKTLYARFTAILVNEFCVYVNSVDLDKVTVEIQETAKAKWTDCNAKDFVPDEVYTKYTQIIAHIKDMDDLSDEIAAFDPTEIVRPDSDVAWTTGGVQEAVNSFWNVLANLIVPTVAPGIDIAGGLDQILADNLYQTSIVEAIFDLYATLSHDTTDLGMMGLTLGDIISMIASTNTIAKLLEEDKFAAAKAKVNAVAAPTKEQEAEGITHLDLLAQVSFTADDFGFTAGDRDGFVNALLAVLRPITTLLAPDASVIIVNVGVKMFDYISKDGLNYVDGVYSNLLPLLEQLGMIGLPTEQEYEDNYYSVRNSQSKAIAADELIRPIIDHLFTDIVDPISADPINGLIEVLPRLGYVVGTDMVNTQVKAALAQMGLLSGLAGSLDLSKDAIDNMLTGAPIDLSGLGVDAKIQLHKIDWNRLANCATVSAEDSSTNTNAKFLLRTGTADLAFTELFYYVYDLLFTDDDNYAALKTIINGLGLDSTIAGVIIMLTDQIRHTGKVETYGMFLDLFGAEWGEEIPGRPETPEDPEDPDKPVNPDKPSEPGNKPNQGGNKPDGGIDVNTGNKPVKNPSLPDTGAEIAAVSFGSVAALALLALAASIVLDRKRRASAEK